MKSVTFTAAFVLTTQERIRSAIKSRVDGKHRFPDPERRQFRERRSPKGPKFAASSAGEVGGHHRRTRLQIESSLGGGLEVGYGTGEVCWKQEHLGCLRK